jgi:very-short-patch-repair endonuclease
MKSFGLSLEATIGQIASGQYGLITAEQLRSIGLSPESIRRRVRAGVLVRMLPGVFRVAAAPRSWQQRAMAASLWVGSNGAVAGASAAALHRLDAFGPPLVIEIATPRNLRSKIHSVKIHRTPFWTDEDRVIAASIGTTSVPRTLIDVAATATEERVEIALEDALRRRLADAPQIMSRLSTLPPNQPGRAALLRLLEQRGAVPPAESGLEVKVIRLLRDHGYPTPIRQKVLDDRGRFVGRVDLVFPERRLILEVDGYRFHSGRRSWDRDRERRNALTALGWVVLHVTSTMLGPQRSEFLRDLERAYSRPL